VSFTFQTQVGADLYDSVGPLTYSDEALGWPLANYVDAIGIILDDIAGLVRTDDEGNDGWSAFADPMRCPDAFLVTLAQWAGVRYPRRMGTEDLRALIGPHAPGLWRGTKQALLDTVARYLTPGGSMYFEERADGNPYLLRIHTYAYDTLDAAALETELLTHVPAGLILEYAMQEGLSYAELRNQAATYAAMRAMFDTYYAVVTYVPPPSREGDQP
jgi:hypothetical protein